MVNETVAEEETVLVPLADREIRMRRPTDGALVVLARISRALPESKIENADQLPDKVREKLVRDLGTLGKVVEGLIVEEADKNWLDDAMIDGVVTAVEVFEVIKVAAEKFNGQAAGGPAKQAAPVRRRR